MARLGFVGLGAMGGRVVKRLLDAGHSVTGYNRTKSKALWLLDAGMQWRDTPRAAASREFAAQVAAKGASMLDVPVSGSVVTLEQGSLSLMVGGEKSVLERVLPVLQDIGPTVNYVGGNGQAVLMKIAVNLNLAVQLLAFSEGLLLAEKGGIPRAVAHQVLLKSVIASPSLKYRTPFILEEPEEAWFDVNMMQKDTQLALEMGRALDVPLPTTAVSNEFLTATRAMGLAKHDFAVLFKALAHMAGVEE